MTPVELQLYQYIEENRPELLIDRAELQSLITARAADSSSEYETLVNAGVEPVSAQESAREILFKDLGFCPCQVIEDIIEENYGVTAHPSVLVNCYLAVKNIFDEYPATDDFIFSPDLDILSSRITQPVIFYLRGKHLEQSLELEIV